MPARWSSCECGPREPRTRRTGALCEHVPVCSFESLQCGKPAARGETDGAPHAAADPLLQETSLREEAPRPLRLEAQQLIELGIRPVELLDSVGAAIFQWEVDPAELQVT